MLICLYTHIVQFSFMITLFKSISIFFPVGLFIFFLLSSLYMKDMSPLPVFSVENIPLPTLFSD